MDPFAAVSSGLYSQFASPKNWKSGKCTAAAMEQGRTLPATLTCTTSTACAKPPKTAPTLGAHSKRKPRARTAGTSRSQRVRVTNRSSTATIARTLATRSGRLPEAAGGLLPPRTASPMRMSDQMGLELSVREGLLNSAILPTQASLANGSSSSAFQESPSEFLIMEGDDYVAGTGPNRQFGGAPPTPLYKPGKKEGGGDGNTMTRLGATGGSFASLGAANDAEDGDDSIQVVDMFQDTAAAQRFGESLANAMTNSTAYLPGGTTVSTAALSNAANPPVVSFAAQRLFNKINADMMRDSNAIARQAYALGNTKARGRPKSRPTSIAAINAEARAERRVS